MVLLAVIAGAVLGVLLMKDFDGLVVGGLLGYLVAEASGLKARIMALEETLKQRRAVGAESIRPPEPPAVQPAAVEPAQPAPAITKPEPAAVRPSLASSARTQAPAGATHGQPSDFVAHWVSVAREFFMGGNTVVRVGVIILFFGIAFLLKYAAEHARLPIELRLAGVALGAMVLLFVGARLRRTRAGYGLTLEGGAIGILGLTVFAAFRLYGLLPASLAFALLVVIFASCIVLALSQNSLALAVLGITGGFLAPVLASTGAGSHVALFGYYALLNAAILVIAWFKAWRLLNLLGFGFTFVIGSAWAYRYYQAEFFGTTEPFLILFFLFYVAVAVLFARRPPPELRRPVDGTLVFGVPIVGFLLQAALVKDYEYGLAWSALVLGGFYLGVAWGVLWLGLTKLLVEAFLALGVIFATLTIPLAVDGHWTAAAWAIEGAGILWVGLRQSHALAQIFGLLLQFGAGLFFLHGGKQPADAAILNSAFVGAFLVAVAGLVSGFLLNRYRTQAARIEGQALANVLLVWGLSWWYGGTFTEIEKHVAGAYEVTAWIWVIGATALIQYLVGERVAWPALRYASLFNLGLLFIALGWSAVTLDHPFARLGVAAWPAALGVYYFVLKRLSQMAQPARTVVHAGAFWLVLAILGWELHWAVAQQLPRSDWPTAAFGVSLVVALWLPISAASRRWPLHENANAYRVVAPVPVALLAIAWIVVNGIEAPGHPFPLPYLPLFNPLDLVAMSLLFALFAWAWVVHEHIRLRPESLMTGFGALAFLWINAVLFRTLHHFAHVPYSFRGMYHSVLAQSAVSIFWTVLAFVLMLIAARARLRALWIAGGALLGVVVVKLFLVDLSSTGTVERIVSFVGVGLLLLVIGYLVPVPPKNIGGAEVR